MTVDGQPLLSVRQVRKAYGGVVALSSADLVVRPGEIHGLVGANGAGKSTLVKILSGVIRRDAGTVEVHGSPVEVRNPREAADAGLATVFQDPAVVPDLTLGQNLALVGLTPDDVWPWLEELRLSTLDPAAMAKDVPLSVLRLFDLARALARDPQLLLLDEITAALPGDQVELVLALMSQWRERGRSVLFITHRLRELQRMCDQATVLRDGRRVATLVPAEGTEQDLVQAMLGEAAPTRAVAEARSRPSGAARAVFEARELSSLDYLKGVSFTVSAGEVLGLVALEGQGQDRLFEVLSGDLPADGGQVVVDGEVVRPRSPYDMVRRGVVLVPADRLHALLPQRSLHENLSSALYNRVARWFRLVGDERHRVAEATERLQIDDRGQREVRQLSGGNQQKVAVGRWLAAGFGTLLCFDPTRGIDVRTKEQLYRLLRELADAGAAVLYYTSEFVEVPQVCDRVLVMYDGRIVDELEPTADEASMLAAAHGLGKATL
ncbi:sugar ABC transporter ATP-binding protein [Jiangella gansuensis]|uniref:sugar ABC transporter ATP-binding protein n=1 Tax=Jiangella gansuensis TaxID=281473 RepID=UPI0004B7EAFD|nr:sugar ABC transporter ATP-binding protein [Jiangella gansuensis]